MDVHNALLHGDLSEKVHMELYLGFSTGHEGKVCPLQKSLYALKQAPRCWFSKDTSAKKDSSFRQSYSNYSLFTYLSLDIFMCVGLCR